MELSGDSGTLIGAELKWFKSELSGAPRPAQFEGLAKQGTAPYTRDRMLTDPRVAQYLADTPIGLGLSDQRAVVIPTPGHLHQIA